MPGKKLIQTTNFYSLELIIFFFSGLLWYISYCVGGISIWLKIKNRGGRAHEQHIASGQCNILYSRMCHFAVILKKQNVVCAREFSWFAKKLYVPHDTMFLEFRLFFQTLFLMRIFVLANLKLHTFLHLFIEKNILNE